MTVKKDHRELPHVVETGETLFHRGSPIPKFVIDKKHEIEIERTPLSEPESGLAASEVYTFAISPKTPLEPGEYLLCLSMPTTTGTEGPSGAGLDFGVTK